MARSIGDAPSPDLARWPEEHIDEVRVYKGGGPTQVVSHLWKDPDFPHSTRSLGMDPEGEVTWIACRNLRRGRFNLFDGIDPNNLLQGQLGNCWLVAAMSCLAEFPDSVRELFQAHEEASGRYTIRLFDHRKDQFQSVVVDEYVPCHPPRWWDSEAKPLFARPNGNEMWCLLLEKAMAKMWGSYAALSGDHCGTAFRALTGEREVLAWEKRRGTWVKMTLLKGETKFNYSPVLGERRDAKGLWERLRKYDQSSYMMGADIDNKNHTDGEEFYYRDDGLVEGHAYSIIRVVEIDNHKLVCLRNPWGGHVEWSGAWSDGDEKWRLYPNVAARIRPEFGDDGRFWMSWEDFSDIYNSINVCCRTMRRGAAVKEHADASLAGTITKMEMGSIRCTSQSSHPAKPGSRILEAVPEAAAGNMARPAANGSFKPGDEVEYYSQSQQKWGPARILRCLPEKSMYDLDVKPGALAANVRAKSRQSGFMQGEDVEYYSQSKQAWVPTKVVAFNAELNLYDLGCKKGAIVECIRRPGQKTPAPSMPPVSAGGAGGRDLARAPNSSRTVPLEEYKLEISRFDRLKSKLGRMPKFPKDIGELDAAGRIADVREALTQNLNKVADRFQGIAK
eukprot:CAMPEP_0178421224 /NCGR_PEP_ID=MMETSP0689_2-20121128/26538_1 /TAXON_ID=160604 /ORGANISM="Amphidinium massartii, Strain CS-259" /LENGTH=617 /DNA_ID=CAMNT_0020042731 /DNA_START=189 /DNA_END=2042 /DNA_ORIENTATION=-